MAHEDVVGCAVECSSILAHSGLRGSQASLTDCVTPQRLPSKVMAGTATQVRERNWSARINREQECRGCVEGEVAQLQRKLTGILLILQRFVSQQS